jgi:hypothetical protein
MSTTLHPAESYFAGRGLRGISEEQALENLYASRMRVLWLAVIERAILDVVEKTGLVNEQASTWLAGGPDFVKVCEFAAVEPFYLQELIRKMLEARKSATASEPSQPGGSRSTALQGRDGGRISLQDRSVLGVAHRTIAATASAFTVTEVLPDSP